MIRIQHQFRMIPIMSRRACHSNQIVYPCLPTVYRYILCSYGPQRSLLRQRCTCVELHHSFAKKCIQAVQKEISVLWQSYLSTNNPSSTNDVMMLLWICILFGECPSDFFLFSSYEWIYTIWYYQKKQKTTWNSLFQVIIFFQPSFGSSFHVPLQCPGVIFHRRTALFLEDALAVLSHCFPSEDNWKSPRKSVTKIWKNQIWTDLDVEWRWMTLNVEWCWMAKCWSQISYHLIRSFVITGDLECSRYKTSTGHV